MQIVDSNNPYFGSKSIVCVGFFDGVHLGHQYLLKQLRKIATEKNLTPIVVTFREHPASLTSPEQCPKLLQTLDQRLDNLSNLGIEHCLLLDFDDKVRSLDALEFMHTYLKKDLKAEVLLMGFDSRFGRERNKEFDFYQHAGIKAGLEVIKMDRFINGVNEFNSSTIRQLLELGKIEIANAQLGYNYCLVGEVIGGYQVGRKMGFPTANIKLHSKCKLTPKQGVYASIVTVDDKRYDAMLNIGIRPTMDNSKQQSIEVHIFDFNKSIYGQTVHIELCSYLRNERKMASIDDLISQLNKDKKEARAWLKTHSQQTMLK